MRWYEKSWINGSWVEGSGEIIESVDLCTQEQLYRSRAIVQQQLKPYLSLIQENQASWARLSMDDRINVIYRFKACLDEHKDLFARTISQEVGKPLWESRTEVSAMLGKVDLSIEAYRQRCPNLDFEQQSLRMQLSHKPHGVVYVVAPFNFPGHLPNGHIIPALIAGNAVIYKPSEFTPRCGELVARLWEMANIPQGIMNFVLTDAEGSKNISEADEVKGVFFTGSDQVGRSIQKNLNEKSNKILALELGGNNPLIISSYSSKKACIQLIIESAFMTAGQRCTCARRLIVIDNASNREMITRLVKSCQKLKVGAYFDNPEPFYGPLINERSKNKILSYQEYLIKKGAIALLESKSIAGLKSAITPAIIDVTDVEREDEELFGPILQLIWVKTFKEALEVANETDYGLSASVVTIDDTEWELSQNNLSTGVLNRNRPTNGASGAMPFGGVNKSGNYRPSGFWAADYCSYPQAQVVSKKCVDSNILSLNDVTYDE